MITFWCLATIDSTTLRLAECNIQQLGIIVHFPPTLSMTLLKLLTNMLILLNTC